MARPRVGDERQEQILAAFEACVVRNGLEKTTLEDVAREAGQPRSLVRYFAGNRSDLVETLIDRMVRRSEAQLRGLAERHGAGNRAELVRLLLGDFFADPVTNSIMTELWHLSVRSEPLRERLAGVYRDILDTLTRQMSSGGDGPDAAARADEVRALFAMGLGTAVLGHFFGMAPGDPDAMAAMAGRLLAPATTLSPPPKTNSRKRT